MCLNAWPTGNDIIRKYVFVGISGLVREIVSLYGWALRSSFYLHELIFSWLASDQGIKLLAFFFQYHACLKDVMFLAVVIMG